jgi:short-subunit dehydrogenase
MIWIILLILILFFLFMLFASPATNGLNKSEQQKLAGKTIVILGASSGFGRGVALKLGAYKANVVLAARRTDLLEEIAAEVRKSGGNALVVTTEISDPESVLRLAQSTLSQFGGIDIWINAVGVGAIGRFWDIPLEDHARLIDVNLKGIIYGSYIAVNYFREKNNKGTLINIGSIDSEVPLAYQGSYAASKAGVRSLSNTLNQELRLDGKKDIKVVTIEPWAVDTPWWGHSANYSGGTPRMGLMDDPSKVVNAILWSMFHCKKEIPVGWKARMSYWQHHIFPHAAETMSGDLAHKYQIKEAPYAPDTTGSLYKPMSTGRGIDDGVRERMKREDEERKAESR